MGEPRFGSAFYNLQHKSSSLSKIEHLWRFPFPPRSAGGRPLSSLMAALNPRQTTEETPCAARKSPSASVSWYRQGAPTSHVNSPNRCLKAALVLPAQTDRLVGQPDYGACELRPGRTSSAAYIMELSDRFLWRSYLLIRYVRGAVPR